MSSLIPISYKNHATKRWITPNSFEFVREKNLLPVVIDELNQVILEMPIVFVEHNDKFILCALLGYHPNINLFVAENGKWKADYVPQILKKWPFYSFSNKNNELVLCVDENSDQISEFEGQPFFDNKGNPSSQIKKMITFIQHYEYNNIMTENACSILNKYNLIKPWPAVVDKRKLNNIYKIDEKSLNNLSDEDYLALRKHGAIYIAHCQLISQHQLKALSRLSFQKEPDLQQIENLDINWSMITR